MTKRNQKTSTTRAVAQQFAACSMLFCAFSAMIILRFQNSTMSETRLFVEFWYAWLSIIGLVFLSAYLLIEKRI